MKYRCLRAFQFSGVRGFSRGVVYDLDKDTAERLREAGALGWLKPEVEEAAPVTRAATLPAADEPEPPRPAAADEPEPPHGAPAGPSKDELRRRLKELGVKPRGGESYQKLEAMIAEAEAKAGAV